MKYILFIILMLLSVKSLNIEIEIKDYMKIHKDRIWKSFISALIYVESSNNPNAIGIDDDVGILQITPIYVKQVNNILKNEKYTLECRKSVEKSLEMFEIMQNFYNHEKDIDRAIKLHNPRAKKYYRDKIIKEMKKRYKYY